MKERLIEIIRKEFRQAFREPRMRTMLFLPPIIQLLVFGYAVNLDVEHANMAWMDQDHTPESRELLAAFQGSGRFGILATPANDREVQMLLDSNKVDMVVRVLPGFQRDIERGRSTAVQILINGTNSNTASIVSSYASSIVANFAGEAMDTQSRNRLAARMAPGPVHAGVPRLNLQSRAWFNSDLLSRNYFVPGIVVNIIMQITLMLTAMAIVREKEIGTMEQLMVTPMRSIELMLGKTLPFAIIGLVDLVVVTAGALVIFRVPFRGNFLVLLFSATIFLLTSLGAGLFLSTISQTQQQANMMSFFFSSPAFMLSGFNFPIRNMPLPVQYLTYLNPLRYFMEIVRGVFLKGVGVAVLWPQMLALLIYGTLILGLSAMRFHKSLD